jgi:hypothetical protein
MWTQEILELDRADAVRARIRTASGPLSWRDTVESWRNVPEFGTWFSNVLAACPFAAFRWETPPVTTDTASRPFEYVVLHSPALATRPDPAAFSEHFERQPESGVIVFPNLGRDAVLVVPRPLAGEAPYGHLGAFVRCAPMDQQQTLWQEVGFAAIRRLGVSPLWVSTAGGGVPWLHVRLDDRPKYYGFAPYRSFPKS